MSIDYRDLDLIIDITEWLGTQGFKFQERSEELIADSCINCGRSKKMYIDKETGLFKCHRCEYKGNAITLVMKVGGVGFKKAIEICYGIKDERIDATKVEEEDWEDEFKEKKKTSRTEEPDPPITLPNYFRKLTTGDSKAWQYLKKRGLTDEVIESLNLYYWDTGNRVVFVVETDGQTMGFMGRDITGTHETKTMNSRGNWRSFNFWNYDRIKNNEEVVLCEGVFSAIKAGPDRSVALMGKVITKGQIALLRTTKAKKLIMCLDVGTEEDQQKAYEMLSVYYPGKIFKVEFPPIIELKERVDQSIIDEINARYKLNIQYNHKSPMIVERLIDDPKVLWVPVSDKQKIKKVIDSKEMIIMSPPAIEFFKALKKMDYIDAGDYTFEEMDDFIKLAKPFKRS